MNSIDVEHITRQIEFSKKIFGPGERRNGVINHICKELDEIVEANNFEDRLAEWIDVIILAIDGAWRCGGTAEQIIDGIKAKQERNEKRNWPDWKTASPDKAIEHIK